MTYFDDAAEQSSRNLLGLNSHLFIPHLDNHVATIDYLIPPNLDKPTHIEQLPDRTFHSNNAIWETIIRERVRSEMNITLNSFFLFEWFPRSPGLFHTYNGMNARSEARNRIEKVENGVVVYNPYGKASMLDGGIGNIRLKPIEIEGENFYLMSASSDGACHEGFPIALPAYLYGKYISEITDRGTVVCTLTGKLKFIPDRFVNLYGGYKEVPKLYLMVEEVRQPEHPKSRRMAELTVSVAVSFVSNFEGHERLYASYVNFDPSKRKSFCESIEWMEQDYVMGKYRGQVITDFDEQMSHFENATFSLQKVMNFDLNWPEMHTISLPLGLHSKYINDLITHQERIQIIIKEFYMDSKYKFSDNAKVYGAVGDDAKAQGAFGENATVYGLVGDNANASYTIDLEILSHELSELRKQAKLEATDLEHDEAVVAIGKAETAAKNGDKSKAFEYLKLAGNWALEIATKIGVVLAAEAIRQSLR